MKWICFQPTFDSFQRCFICIISSSDPIFKKFNTFRWYKWGGFWWSGAQGDLWLDRGTPSSSSTWSHGSTRLSRVIKQNQVKIGVVSRALLVEESCWFENSLEGWKLWAYLFNWENKQKIDWVFVGLNTNMILCSHKYWFNL